jgi:hypothetical protein
MAIHKVPLTVGYRHNKIVGHITIDPEIENILLMGGMFVLCPSIVEGELNKPNEIIELTLLPLPASEGG